jgi:DNA-binding beta-propeller fold protein YncE
LLGSVLLHAAALQAAACGSASPSALTPTSGQRSGAPVARVTFTRGSHHSVQMADRVPIFDRVAFASPAAIVFDAERDLYWVSNLNGEGPKGKGFISRLEPTAERSTLNYIDGQKPGVTLESPRGLAVFGDVLYVADVRTVRRFKASTGEPLEDIDIPGAALLTDVAVALDGSLYVADVGGDPSEASLPDVGQDAVYQVSTTGQVSTVTRRPNLGGPYALVANETGLWVTCTGSNELLLLVPSADGSPVADAGRLPLPGAAPRGIVAMPDGTFVISSDAGNIYRGFRDGPFQPLLSELELPADLGYDTKRQRLLIPLLGGHSLAIFELSPLPPSSSKP